MLKTTTRFACGLALVMVTSAALSMLLIFHDSTHWSSMSPRRIHYYASSTTVVPAEHDAFAKRYQFCMQQPWNETLPFAIPAVCRLRIHQAVCTRAAGLVMPPESSMELLKHLDPTMRQSVIRRVADASSQMHPPLPRLAYILLLHNGNARFFERLWKRLYDERDVYAIHIDAAVDETERRNLLRIAAGGGGVQVLVVPPEESAWGLPGLTRATVSAMRLLTNASANWDFVINLSGSCFPIATDGEIRSFLAFRRGVNFVDFHDDSSIDEGTYPSMVECERKLYHVGEPVHFKGAFLPKGSQWFIFSRDLVMWAARSLAFDLIVRALEPQPMSDERAIQTAVYHSPFKATLARFNYRSNFAVPGMPCRTERNELFVGVQWCGRGPRFLELGDLDVLTSTRIGFWARKFSMEHSASLLSTLETMLNASTPQWSLPPKMIDAAHAMAPFFRRVVRAALPSRQRTTDRMTVQTLERLHVIPWAASEHSAVTTYQLTMLDTNVKIVCTPHMQGFTAGHLLRIEIGTDWNGERLDGGARYLLDATKPFFVQHFWLQTFVDLNLIEQIHRRHAAVDEWELVWSAETAALSRSFVRSWRSCPPVEKDGEYRFRSIQSDSGAVLGEQRFWACVDVQTCAFAIADSVDMTTTTTSF